MKKPAIHFAFPVVIVVLYTLFGLSNAGVNIPLAFIIALLIFCFPHVCWALTQKYAKPSDLIAHAGYFGASLALAIIVFKPPNALGLLNHWLEYWRLAFIFMFVGVGVGFAAHWRYS